MIVKGNKGKATRSRLIQRLVYVIVTCLSIIVLFELTGYGRRSRQSDSNSNISDKSSTDSGNQKNIRRKHRKERTNYNYLSRDEKLHLIISGQVQLQDIRIGRGIQNSLENDYEDVTGYFCELDWSLHKNDPSKYPMFKDLVSKSNCNKPFEFDLKEAAEFIKKHIKDKTEYYSTDSTLQPSGFIFHESRCGSTLAANSLVASSPKTHRVYSESGPPLSAIMSCGLNGTECAKGTAAALFRDVVLLMSRSDDEHEEKVFFKIQSLGSKYIDIVLEAFPSTPWIFIYRHPVHVIMSQIANGVERANCVRQLHEIPHKTRKMLKENGMTMRQLTPEMKCALHLGLLCESATNALERSKYGKAVNYDGIVNHMIKDTLPNHFKIPMTDANIENVVTIGSKYSKGRGNRAREFKDDNKKKEDAATPEVKEATEMFLNHWFNELEQYS